MSRLTVSRKGHKRKAYTARRAGKRVHVEATRVRPSRFKISDRGRKGRGPKIVPPLERGALGGPGFFSRSIKEQEEIVFNRARRLGEKKVVGELRALQVFFKNTDPRKSRRALALSKKVAGSFKGRKMVSYPRGLSRSRAA
jgi:hypothetical protein